jgi:hypothetical protein
MLCGAVEGFVVLRINDGGRIWRSRESEGVGAWSLELPYISSSRWVMPRSWIDFPALQWFFWKLHSLIRIRFT